MNKTSSKTNKTISNGIGGLAILFTKLGSKLMPILVKFTKLLKFGKVGLAGLTMVSYVYLFTWQFAIMVMVSLFVHESGHIWAMKRCGLKTKGIYFVPFMGAAAVTDETFKSRKDEMFIAIMGPIWGLGLALLTGIVYFKTGDALFGAIAGFMAMINLFNLLPVNPLDGGRMMKSITFSVHSKLGYYFLVLGIIVSAIIIFYFKMALFLILLFIACVELYGEQMRRDPKEVVKMSLIYLNRIKYDGLPPRVRITINDLKSILSNDNYDPIDKMEKVVAKYNELLQSKFEIIEYMPDQVVRVCLNMKYKLENKAFKPLPKMTARETLISAASYVLIVAVFWGFISFMISIPEVKAVREIFM